MERDDDAGNDDRAPALDTDLSSTPREEMDAVEDAEQGLLGRQRRRRIGKLKR